MGNCERCKRVRIWDAKLGSEVIQYAGVGLSEIGLDPEPDV